MWGSTLCLLIIYFNRETNAVLRLGFVMSVKILICNLQLMILMGTEEAVTVTKYRFRLVQKYVKML